MSRTVKDLLDVLNDAFPFSWAEPWDKVGLLLGDRDAGIEGVFVTLDPTREAVEKCVSAGANVLLTHHPAFLVPPAFLGPGSGPGGVAYAAALQGVALVACHTNLDRAPAGALSLGRALGLEDGEPVESSAQPMTLITVFAPALPAETHSQIAEAMSAAGAGRIGEYAECSFTGSGIGRYTALQEPGVRASDPGKPTPTEAAEERLEMVCAPADADRVIAAARAVHPYVEPLIVRTECAIARSAARLGRVTDLPAPITLADLAQKAAAAFASTPRVWGDASRRVVRVATATGSAGGLLGDVHDSGADALVAGEVRYHDALTAMASGLGIIELGHDVSEWPLVPVLAHAVRTAWPDISIEVEPPLTQWWTP
ncbi:MAG: Nif3-like dinuclear metal center hexameric protein [Coriobacteriia bacterium]